MSWVAKLFCCGEKEESRHIPTPSRKQIKLWEAREKELRKAREHRETKAENER